jgi:HAMP domain-containing protein
MKTEREIQNTLNELQRFCNEQGHITEEMQGEIQALEYALNKLRQDLF